MKLTLYGITNCDTVKRARAWLAQRRVEVEFHDFKKAGVPEARLQAWMAALGWEPLVNRQGLTWKKLEVEERLRLVDAASAAALMRRASSVIRRPVVEWPGGDVTVGFDEAAWSRRVPPPG